MALKAVVAKLEDVQESWRSLYKRDGEQFVLDVDGMVLESELTAADAKVTEFRDKNIKLLKENENLAAKYKDVDPDEYGRLKTEKAALEKQGVTKPNDIAIAIQEAVQKATAPLEDRLKTMEGEKRQAEESLTTRTLEDKLWEVGVKAGIKETARIDYLRRAKDYWKLEKGKLVAVDPTDRDTPLYSKRRGQASSPLSPEEWATEPDWLLKEADHLYKNSSGSDSRGKPGKDGGGGSRVIANDAETVSRSLEDIAKGRVVVAGT